MEMLLIHKFTDVGLGQAPFRFNGVTENAFKLPDGTTKPGGTCDYCFTGIRYEYHIISACGKKSKVGCDCIRRINDSKLMSVCEIAKKKFLKEQRIEKEYKRREARLQQEREANGGKTNYELLEEARM